jgi:hypothetical protein
MRQVAKVTAAEKESVGARTVRIAPGFRFGGIRVSRGWRRGRDWAKRGASRMRSRAGDDGPLPVSAGSLERPTSPRNTIGQNGSAVRGKVR